jgi:hypothetical protein
MKWMVPAQMEAKDQNQNLLKRSPKAQLKRVRLVHRLIVQAKQGKVEWNHKKMMLMKTKWMTWTITPIFLTKMK